MNVCLYVISNGIYSDYAEALIESVGRFNKYDFIAVSDRPLRGARHTIKLPDNLSVKDLWFYKVEILSELKSYDYDYYVLLDADTHCCGKFNIDRFADLPCFAIFGEDLKKFEKSWWGKSPDEISQIFGVDDPRHLNGGFFGVNSDYINDFLNLFKESKTNWSVSEEPNLAYAIYKLCDISPMLYDKNFDLHSILDYKTDPNLIINKKWTHKTWISKTRYIVKPSLIHFMTHKDFLIKKTEVKYKYDPKI